MCGGVWVAAGLPKPAMKLDGGGQEAIETSQDEG